LCKESIFPIPLLGHLFLHTHVNCVRFFCSLTQHRADKMETAALLMSLSGATDLPETASMALDTVTYPFPTCVHPVRKLASPLKPSLSHLSSRATSRDTSRPTLFCCCGALLQPTTGEDSPPSARPPPPLCCSSATAVGRCRRPPSTQRSFGRHCFVCAW
jgi:hypothetical protein